MFRPLLVAGPEEARTRTHGLVLCRHLGVAGARWEAVGPAQAGRQSSHSSAGLRSTGEAVGCRRHEDSMAGWEVEGLEVVPSMRFR